MLIKHTSQDMMKALSEDFIYNYEQQIQGLTTLFEGMPLRTKHVGEVIQINKAVGEMTSPQIPEYGENILLTKISLEPVDIGTLEIYPFATLTTIKDIFNYGSVESVMKRDQLLISEIIQWQWKAWMTAFATALDTAASDPDNITKEVTSSTGLQDLLMQLKVQLTVNQQAAHVPPGTPIFFVNPLDLASLLGNTVVETQTLFGLTYYMNFLGLPHIVEDINVPEGTVYATFTQNLLTIAPEWPAELLTFDVSQWESQSPFLMVGHKGSFARYGIMTEVLASQLLVPLYTDICIKGTLSSN